MGSRHRDRSSRERSRSRGRDRDRRSRHRSKSRDRRSRSRDRRSKSKDRRRDRRGSRRTHRSKSRESRDRKSWDRKSRDRSRERSSHKAIEEDKQQQVALLDTLTSIATSRNFSSLVSSVKEELINQNSNGSTCSGGEAPPNETEKEREERRQRRRKSRWGGGEHDKTFIPGMPTILPSTLNKEQEEAYLLQLQIEEVSRKLRSGDLGIPANIEERCQMSFQYLTSHQLQERITLLEPTSPNQSPSPEPIYSSDGKRLNTREFRTRRRLEEERHALVLKMQAINPEFKPPVDYKPPIIRVNDKVMIPQEQHPEINFVGLLIGPRGNTLKTMEKETGAKIIIRGKGSVKEGKVGRKDGQPLPGEDEPLHAYITATNPEAVKKAVERIKEVIRQGVEVPENQNDLRRMQLRELAQLNGTLRENDGPRCSNCGATDHKSWQCPDKPNITNNIVCSSCGGAGHIARDCRQKRPGMGGPPQPGDRAKIDEEYMSLMAELGEGPSPDMLNSNNGALKRNVGYPNMFERAMAPRAIMGGPVRPDQQLAMQGQPQMMNNGIPPPWGQTGPQMACTPMGGPGGMPPNMAWGPGPACPPGMMPPPPPPGATSPSNIPPLMPWMTANNQPPPPGSAGAAPAMPPPPPPQVTQAAANGSMVPPPVPWSQGPPPPPPPGIDINTFAGLPNLLAAPPPPPPS